MDNKKAVIFDKNFFVYNEQLANIGATYVSLLMFDRENKLQLTKSSNLDWSDEFTSTELYKDCHLLNEANNQMKSIDYSFTLAWDLYQPITEKQKSLDDIRKYRDINHGVGFCFKNPDGSRLLLSIAGKYSDINFGLNVLKNRAKIYKDLKKLTAFLPTKNIV